MAKDKHNNSFEEELALLEEYKDILKKRFDEVNKNYSSYSPEALLALSEATKAMCEIVTAQDRLQKRAGHRPLRQESSP
jgi:hypothetical protein